MCLAVEHLLQISIVDSNVSDHWELKMVQDKIVLFLVLLKATSYRYHMLIQSVEKQQLRRFR